MPKVWFMEQAKALMYSEYGKPGEVLQVEHRSVAEPGEREVSLKILAAPIHPSDMGMILGKYGNLAELPAVAGREGVAEVVQTGAGVTEVAEGDRVMVPRGTGSWQSRCTVPAEGLFPVPAEVPTEMAAMCTVNPPTAWRLLRDAHIEEGSWVVQNAANSAVGLHVIQMARYLGLRTLNVVRREELVEPLKQRGADVVVLEDSGYEKRIQELTGGERVLLALNSVGGESAIRLVKALSPGGQHVTFGAMTFEQVRFPTRDLIFENKTLRGFWMDRWYRENSENRVRIMFDKVFDLMAQGVVKAEVEARYPLDQFREALAASAKPRLGKVLFSPQD